jgi:hypothetical protein
MTKTVLPVLVGAVILLAFAAPVKCAGEVVVEYETSAGRAPLLQALDLGDGVYVLTDPGGTPVRLEPERVGDSRFIALDRLVSGLTEAPPPDENGRYVLFAHGSDEPIVLDGGLLLVQSHSVPGRGRRTVLMDGNDALFPGDDGTLVFGADYLEMLEAGAVESEPGIPVLGGAALPDTGRTDREALKALIEWYAVNEPAPGGGAAWRFLRDFNFELIGFEEDGRTGFGLAYAYKRSAEWKSLGGRNGPDSLTTSGLSYSIRALGKLAANRMINPTDLQEAALSLTYFRSTGGMPRGRESRAWAIQSEIETLAADTTDAVFETPRARGVTHCYQEGLRNQFHWEAGLDAAVETDQALTERNYLLGGHLFLNLKAWRQDSALAWMNIVDHPFALIRLLTGYDTRFTPRGSAIPSVLVAYDHVTPDGDTPRTLAGDSSDYDRVRAELSFKTPLALTGENEFFFSAVWQLYAELAPSDVVTAAGLDTYDFLSLTLESEKGLFVSYGLGQHPFDSDEREFYELGLKTRF